MLFIQNLFETSVVYKSFTFNTNGFVPKNGSAQNTEPKAKKSVLKVFSRAGIV